MERRRICMTIAGSDSGGGAGIQADLKAFARCGVHGTCVVAAITAQNTVAVTHVLPVPPATIRAQAEALLTDLPPDAVKIGMVGGREAITVVAAVLDALPTAVPVVLDPVMVAESGGRLLDPEAEAALVAELLPRATVVTPNVPEAQVLARHGAGAEADGEELARAVLSAGARAVVLTGGHTAAGADLLLSGPVADPVLIDGPRHPDGAAHGSGCTHASVLAARLARGDDLEAAARVARRIAADAVAHGIRGIGAGAGPVDVLAGVVEDALA